MKNLLLTFAALALFSKDAFAGCTDKCIIRNPFSGNCAYEMRVCPLSTDTVLRWVNGATPENIRETLADIDPTYALGYYARKLKLDINVNQNVTACVINIAGAGAFGTACAAGVAELGPLCFAELTCTASCAGAGSTFKNVLEDCAG